MQRASAHGDDDGAALRAGHFLVVRSILRVLPHGIIAKATLDTVVDAAAAMQNLRTVIAEYRERMLSEPREEKRRRILRTCNDHLERYCMLITFSSYMMAESIEPGRTYNSFHTFVSKMPEIESALDHLVRAFPLLSLELTGKPANQDESGKEPPADMQEMSEAISKRNGAILSAYTILKADQYPSLFAPSIPQVIAGAPNFRQAEASAPVFGMGISTVQGISEALRAVGAAPGTPPLKRTAIATNLREEPVLYINGTPYVLREAAGAYTNMKDYRGIGAERLEALETRLKQEVLADAQRGGGRVHVLCEAPVLQEASDQRKPKGQLFNRYEDVSSEAQLQTPKEVFESLHEGGYHVQYRRLPLTDGRTPRHEDTDMLQEILSSAPRDACFIFSCQQGKGRTTVAMVAATLFLSAQAWAASRQFSIPREWHVTAAMPADACASKQISLRSAMSLDSESNFDGVESPTMRSRASSAAGLAPQTPSASATSLSSMMTKPDTPQLTLAPRHPQYVGIRRVTRELAGGATLLPWLDCAVDACGHMVNLRTAIGVYRAMSTHHFMQRAELGRIRQAFSRDAVALARYCLLLAYAAYLERHAQVPAHIRPRFSEWIASMASVQAALAAPLRDPMHALSEIVSSRVHSTRSLGSNCDALGDTDGPLDSYAVQVILSRRRFRMLTPQTILKSVYLPSARDGDAQVYPSLGSTGKASLESIKGAHDLRRMTERPVWIVSNPSVQGLRGISEHLAVKPGSRVVIIDTREELHVYLGGEPFARRDLDMPTASLHHAGIHWRELARLEHWLLEDTRASAAEWQRGGAHRVLVHHEASGMLPRNSALPHSPSASSGLVANAADVANSTMTAGARLEACWARVPEGQIEDIDSGIVSVWQVAAQLRSEGHRVHYHRVPLSRNRDPAPLDLQELHDSVLSGQGDVDNVNFVVMAKSASTSTSCAFVAHFLSATLPAFKNAADGLVSDSRASTAAGHASSPDIAGSSVEGRSPVELMSQLSLEAGTSPPAGAPHPPPRPSVRRLGNSTISNVCRALNNGTRWRRCVDTAVHEFHSIESPALPVRDVIDSIEACKHKLSTLPDTPEDMGALRARADVRRLGRRYVMRYLLLICFRGYLSEWMREEWTGSGGHATSRFREWFDHRKELSYLLEHCKL